MKVKSLLAYHTEYGKNRHIYDPLALNYANGEIAKVIALKDGFNNALYKILKTHKELKIFGVVKTCEEMKKQYFELFLSYFKLKMDGQAKTPPEELIEKVIKEKNYEISDSTTLLEKILSQKKESGENESMTPTLKSLSPLSSPLKVYKRGTPPSGKHILQKLLGFYS